MKHKIENLVLAAHVRNIAKELRDTEAAFKFPRSGATRDEVDARKEWAAKQPLANFAQAALKELEDIAGAINLP